MAKWFAVGLTAFCSLGASELWAAGCGGFEKPALEAIALELIEADLAGARLPGGSACLKELKPVFTRAWSDPVQEGGLAPESVAIGLKPKVLSVKTLGKGEASATYVLGSGKAAIRDEVTFLLNRDPKVQEKYGCGGVLAFPKKWRVRQHCLPPVTLQKGR